jgi:hypothetical protein
VERSGVRRVEWCEARERLGMAFIAERGCIVGMVYGRWGRQNTDTIGRRDGAIE